MFMSISLVRELPVLRQNTELTNKTRQNITHQHTEAAVRGAIVLDNNDSCINSLLLVVFFIGFVDNKKTIEYDMGRDNFI